MAATENGSVVRTASGDSGSPSPFAGHSDKPHTSISSLPDVPVPMDSTARRRRRSETQELRTKVELLGTKVSSYSKIANTATCEVIRCHVLIVTSRQQHQVT